jgi:hypothetical protein
MGSVAIRKEFESSLKLHIPVCKVFCTSVKIRIPVLTSADRKRKAAARGFERFQIHISILSVMNNAGFIYKIERFCP